MYFIEWIPPDIQFDYAANLGRFLTRWLFNVEAWNNPETKTQFIQELENWNNHVLQMSH